MRPTIRIVPGSNGESPAGNQYAGSESTRQVAAIDIDILEADSQELGGERFWEAYWTTQHTYGGIVEGQTLATMLTAQPDRLLDKLAADIRQLQQQPGTMHDSDKNDVLGMVMFLLSLERREPGYNPFEERGVNTVLREFSESVAGERRRRGLDT